MRMPKWASISGTMPRSIAAARASLGLDLHHLEAAGQGGVLLEVLLYSAQVVAAMVRSSPGPGPA
jgi:hypothetical protein